jgi:hypothetical protein
MNVSERAGIESLLPLFAEPLTVEEAEEPGQRKKIDVE